MSEKRILACLHWTWTRSEATIVRLKWNAGKLWVVWVISQWKIFLFGSSLNKSQLFSFSREQGNRQHNFRTDLVKMRMTTGTTLIVALLATLPGALATHVTGTFNPGRDFFKFVQKFGVQKVRTTTELPVQSSPFPFRSVNSDRDPNRLIALINYS